MGKIRGRGMVSTTIADVIDGRLISFQALVFHGDGSALTCEALFRPEWTMKLYVTWYAISNLFVPLAVLMFCYGRIWEEAKLDQMHWKLPKVLPATLTLAERGALFRV